jgi:hypothetical protein
VNAQVGEINAARTRKGGARSRLPIGHHEAILFVITLARHLFLVILLFFL